MTPENEPMHEAQEELLARLDVLREGRSLRRWARELGMSLSKMSLTARGQRPIGEKLWLALMVHYPDREHEIAEAMRVAWRVQGGAEEQAAEDTTAGEEG